MDLVNQYVPCHFNALEPYINNIKMMNTFANIVASLNDRLLFAVPKKGRLHTACLDLLSGSDIQFHRHNRLDIALVKNLPLALIFLPAADIPTFVGEGKVDLGITGRDQVAEHEAVTPATGTTGVQELMDLGFGMCKLQVQVPEHGGIESPEQLVGMNVVTSFTNLALNYFKDLEAKDQSAQTNGNGMFEAGVAHHQSRICSLQSMHEMWLRDENSALMVDSA